MTTLKKEIKNRVQANKAEQKRTNKERSSLPRKERQALRKQDKTARKEARAIRKAEIAAMDKKAARQAKKEDRLYRWVWNRPRRWGITGGILLLIVVLVIGFTRAFPHFVGFQVEDRALLNQAREEGAVLNEQIEAEGTVLLKNEDNLLPLSSDKVNVFGLKSIDPYYSGSGGGVIHTASAIDFYTALNENGISFNAELQKIYEDWLRNETEPEWRGFTGDASIQQIEMPVENLTDSVISDAQDFSDVAIIFVGRNGSEDHDLTAEVLTIRDERAMIEKVASEFSNVIVILNIGNALELGWVDEYESIKAVLNIGYPGLTGFRAVAKILNGTYNPSGRLVDTFAYDVTSSPAMLNFGDYTYDNGDKFVHYEEGIYVGYRFYETFYLDDEAGYEAAVQYPFGYGLSYTTFDWELAETRYDSDTINVDVSVTNTGAYAGKDVVQVYYTPPYYPESGIEKSAIALGGFGKTSMLQPGESETVSITFDTDNMASFSIEKGYFVLEQGAYEIKVARNVHDIVFTENYELNENIEIKFDDVTGTKITNLFGSVDGGLTYLSRNDFENTYPQSPIGDDFETPQAVLDAAESKVIEPQEGTPPTTGANNGLMLADLVGLDYDDPLWDEFLDQLTVEEMAQLFTDGGWETIKIQRLGVPGTMDLDGPADIAPYFGINTKVGFSNETILASTWNVDLAYAMGDVLTDVGRAIGAQGWFSPAMNIHRTPTAGRNFEYYSEDPMISAAMAVAETQAAVNNGFTTYLKHLGLNDQETNRFGVMTWANEQAMREIYLLPFEMSIKEGGSQGIMTGLNSIGAFLCVESKPLLTDLLREEWGFEGRVLTDIIFPDAHVDYYRNVNAGVDGLLQLYGAGTKSLVVELYDKDPVGMGNALRNAAHNSLYAMSQTYLFED